MNTSPHRFRLSKLSLICALTGLMLPRLFANDPADFFTQTGTDLPFQTLVDNGTIVPGERFWLGAVLGSTITVNQSLLQQQTGVPGPIGQVIRIHTQVNGSIQRGNFPNSSRWYQEDGNVQIMRLFEGEQNIRDGIGPQGTPGRIEAFFPYFTVEPGTWAVWEGTYTIIEPISANIFQLFHDGGQLWPFHLRMTTSGNITFNRRREIAGLPSNITIATNMVGKSISIRVRANGSSYEVFKKIPGVDPDWELVTTGSYIQAVDNRISFRWGMYVGSQAGQSISKDALLFVSGANRTTSIDPGIPPPPPPPPPITYYWDNNGASPGFGTASGVWGETTTGNSSQGWSTDPTGATLPVDTSTTSSDPVFFGTNVNGLGSGTLTVSDTVGAGDITFGSASGNITLAGGEIVMNDSRVIDVVGSGSTHTIHSVLSGSGSRTIGGSGTLVLTGENTFTGPLFVGNNSGSLRLRINSIGNANGDPSAAGAPTSATNGIIQLGATSNSSTLELTGSSAAQFTNRRIRVGSDGGGSGGASIQNNNSNSAHTLTFTNSAFNVAATNTTSFNRTLNLGGSNSGDNVIQGAIIDNIGGSGGRVILTKSGSGTWVLAGSNTYTGSTTISSGVLRIGNGGSSGELSPSSSITNNGTLEFRRSNTITQGTHFSGSSITGTGSVIQSGSGTTILNVSNAYSGLTTIDAGALRILHGGALGSTAAGTVVNGTAPSGSPRLELAGNITVSGESLTLSGGGNFRGALSSQSGNNEWAGPITIAAPETRIGTADGATLRVSGVINSGGQPHGLTVRGGPPEDGAIILSGVNTYVGDTTLLIGKLQLDGGNNRIPPASRFVSGNFGDRTELDLNGRNQELSGLALRPNVNAPSSNVINNSSGTLATLTVNTALGDPSSYGGILAGNLALTKTGPDTLTLTGSHTYTGPTAVNQGTLALVGASLTSPVTLATGASLAFTTGFAATSSSTLQLGQGTVKVYGTVDGSSDYLLLTASGGITGTPLLHTPVSGYELEIQDGGTRLVLAHVGVTSAFGLWSGGATPGADNSGDGVSNAVAWVLGAATPLERVLDRLPALDNNGDPDTLMFVFNRLNEAATDPNTTIVFEFGNDLIGWTPAVHNGDDVVIDVIEGSPTDRVEVRLRRSAVAPEGRLFGRLRVTITSP